MNNRIAVCPGSFDPVTIGHLDIIRRAAALYDEVIVVVMVNGDKHYTFSPSERVEMIKEVAKDLKNVKVEHYSGLLAEYVKSKSAGIIVKGLRAMSDFEYEFQMALANRKLNPEAETIFLSTSASNMYLSSSMVKQIASMGGDISDFVPEIIKAKIISKIKGEN